MFRALVIASSILSASIAGNAQESPLHDVAIGHEHLSHATLAAGHFAIRASVPEGWSAVDDQLVPPAELRASCRVRLELDANTDWTRTLAAAEHHGDVAHFPIQERNLFRHGAHNAVRIRSVDGSAVITTTFIDLGDAEPGALAIWSVERDGTAAGRRCESDFKAFEANTSIDLAAGASLTDATAGARATRH